MSSRNIQLQETHSSFSSLCDWIILISLQVVMVFVPLFFLVKNEEVFEFNKMLFSYAAAIIIVCAWSCKTIFEKKLKLQKTPLDWFILLFIFSQLVSTALSMHPRTSLFGYYTRFHGGLFSTLTYFTFYYATATFVKRKHLVSFLTSILGGALFATLYAFPEHFGHSPSCLLLTNEFNASCWIQDVQSRVFGTFGQPNWLAAYLILLIPLSTSAIFIFEKDEEKNNPLFATFGKMFLISLSAVMFATLLFTKSRSGFLGFALSFIVLIFLFAIQMMRTKHHAKTQLISLGAVTISIIICAAIFGTPFSSTFSQLLAPTPPTTNNLPLPPAPDRLETGGTDSGEIRRIVWKGAIDVWKRYPLFGSGVETFGYSYYKDRPMEHNTVSEWDFLYNKAHNELLNFLATTGAFGLISYLLLHAALGWFLFKESLFNKEVKVQILSIGVLSGLAALHVSNFFGFSTVMVTILMYVLPALVISLMTDGTHHMQWKAFSFAPATMVEDSQQGFFSKWLSRFTPKFLSSNSSTNSVSVGQWLVVSVVMMAGVYFTFQVLMIWLADHYYSQAKEAYKNSDYDTGITKTKLAIELSPKEGLYYELYSKISAQYAISALQQNENDLGSQFANSAIEASNTSLLLNPVHLNFYKSRNQVLVTLAQAQPQLFESAVETLRAAQVLAPTDPKLVYYTGLVQHAEGKEDEAITELKRVIEMKPNYDSARFLLAQIYEMRNNLDGATEQYQYILEHIAPDNQQVKDRLEVIATMSGKKK